MRQVSAEVWEQLKASARRGVLAEFAARSALPVAAAGAVAPDAPAGTSRHSLRPNRGA